MTETTPSEVDALAAEILAAEAAAAADAADAGALNPDPPVPDGPPPPPDAVVMPASGDEVFEAHNPFSPNISPEAAPGVVIEAGEPPVKAPAKKAAAKK